MAKWSPLKIQTWRDVMEWNARLFVNKVGVIDVLSERQWTFGEFNKQVNRLANALYRELGLEKGDRIAVFSGDMVEYVQIAATCKAGLVWVPVNWRLKGHEAAYIINDSGAKVLFVDEAFADAIRSVRSDIPNIKHFICINANPRDMLNYDELVAKGTPEDPEVDVSEDDILGLVYTSGTTALPKGVVRTHKNTIQYLRMLLYLERLRSDDIVICHMPLFHVGMLHNNFEKYMSGLTQYIMRFDTKGVMEAIQKYRATHFMGVPTMIQAITDHPERAQYDLSSLRSIMYVGAPMPAEVAKRVAGVFGANKLIQLYGATEGTGLTVLYPEDHERALSDPTREHILNSAGKPVTGCELKIVDDNDNMVPVGMMGEICFRSEAPVESYWNKPKDTAETFKEGWYHTGDMGKMDEEGYVYIMDRKKDVIKSGGENISGREVEDVIYTHPSVLEVAVIGIPSEEWGEEVKALVVPKPGMNVTPEEVIAYCKDRMAGFKRPKSIEIRSQLPRNPTGKILKKELREKYWAGMERRVH